MCEAESFDLSIDRSLVSHKLGVQVFFFVVVAIHNLSQALVSII